MTQRDWIEHRRADRERVGWLRPEGDGFVAIDLLGRERSEEVDWLTGEEILETLGLSYLSDPYEIRLDSGDWLRVRLVEVSEQRVLAKTEDWGDVQRPWVEHSLPFPPGAILRPAGGAPAADAAPFA